MATPACGDPARQTVVALDPSRTAAVTRGPAAARPSKASQRFSDQPRDRLSETLERPPPPVLIDTRWLEGP